MAVRPYKDRKGNIIPGKFVVDYYPHGQKGKKIITVIWGNEADARVYEMEVRRLHNPSISISPKVADAVADWLDWYKINRSENTHGDVTKVLKHLLPFFGNLKFSYITPSLIEQYKAKRLSEKIMTGGKARKEGATTTKRRTINKELNYLSGLLKYASKHNYCHPLPFKIETFEKVRPPKPVIPTAKEMQALLDSIDPEYYLVALLMYDAGLRRSEALSVKAEDIFHENGFFRVIGKGNKERFIPITTARLKTALVKACKKTGTGYLSVNPETGKPWHSIRKALTRAAKKAGISQKVYHHLLRHSFGTHGLAAGINMRALQGIMGHEDIKTTEIYTHLLGDFLGSEGAKFDNYISKQKITEPIKKVKKSKPKH